MHLGLFFCFIASLLQSFPKLHELGRIYHVYHIYENFLLLALADLSLVALVLLELVGATADIYIVGIFYCLDESCHIKLQSPFHHLPG